ncbi:uncharacterized protein [Littorina saxatilis]|uniref:uncharacterized protein isoform X2 n=1 Tax=Littorina saxatilis TaxID=31220 RepID=UPI0038B4D2DC
MNPVAITVATLTLTLTLISHVTCFPYLHGGLRAEDGIPLDTVASDLSDRLTKMTAQLQAQDVLITDLKTRLASVLTPAVVFTATFSRVDIRGLDDQQVLKFDKVLTNVGQGYSPDTGLFTAPEHGTYIFNVHDKDLCKCLTAQLDKMQLAWVSVPERNARELSETT